MFVNIHFIAAFILFYMCGRHLALASLTLRDSGRLLRYQAKGPFTSTRLN